MFKSFALAALSLVSVSAMASGVEFYSKFSNQECIIKNGVASKTVTFGKERDVKIKTEHKVSIEGLNDYIDLAMANTVSVPTDADYSTYKVTKNNKTVQIFQNDSYESLLVVQAIIQACK